MALAVVVPQDNLPKPKECYDVAAAKQLSKHGQPQAKSQNYANAP